MVSMVGTGECAAALPKHKDPLSQVPEIIEWWPPARAQRGVPVHASGCLCAAYESS